MRADTIAAFVALAATIQSVATAGVNWHHASPFTCPRKTPEICVPKQHSGLDWLELAEGKFEDYAGFKFRGFDCKNSFGGFERDALPRFFNQKCANAEASADSKNCPKISAKDVKAFSITTFQVSVEFDCDLEFHYTLPNNSTCKQKTHCKKSGTIVENTQCGGATDVTIIYPKPPTEVSKKTCRIGLHKIEFSCRADKPNVPSVSVGPNVPTIPTLPETPSGTSTTSQITVKTPVDHVESKLVQETHILTVIITDHVSTTICPVTSTVVVDGSTSIDVILSTSTFNNTKTQTITSCDGGCTREPKQTVIVASSVVENFPVTTVVPETETPEEPETDTPDGKYPPVLPRCLNTWLPDHCASNSDADCFCPKPDFTKNVYECLAAHGTKQADIDAAVQYFQGICAPYVPKNPGIVVDTPDRDDEDNSPVKAPEVPVTTIVLETTIEVPCTPEAETTSCTVSIIKTTVTAPQVIFTTVSGGEVIPVPGTATASPAVTATPTNVVPSAIKPGQEVPPYPTRPASAPTTGPPYPTRPVSATAGPTAPATSVPVAVGTISGLIGTITKPYGPNNTVPVFAGVGSKTAVSGFMAAGALLALFL